MLMTVQSLYKHNEEDCANFVSQCLYDGGLSKMTKEWYHHIYLFTSVLVSGLH